MRACPATSDIKSRGDHVALREVSYAGLPTEPALSKAPEFIEGAESKGHTPTTGVGRATALAKTASYPGSAYVNAP